MWPAVPEGIAQYSDASDSGRGSRCARLFRPPRPERNDLGAVLITFISSFRQSTTRHAPRRSPLLDPHAERTQIISGDLAEQPSLEGRQDVAHKRCPCARTASCPPYWLHRASCRPIHQRSSPRYAAAFSAVSPRPATCLHEPHDGRPAAFPVPTPARCPLDHSGRWSAFLAAR